MFNNMWDVLVSGGPVMIPICGSAFVATVIIIERLLYFRRLSKNESIILLRLTSVVEKDRFEEALAICDSYPSPFSDIVKAGIQHREYGEEKIKEAIMDSANSAIPKMERYFNALGTIANISTLLGLLGTVTGNIRAFGVLSQSGDIGNPARLAGAIAEALITTAAGLIVSIPVVVFYNYFVAKVNRIITRLESLATEMVIRLGVKRI
jgi:biopolymer transport protein ExbB